MTADVLHPFNHDRFWSKVDKTDGCWLWTAWTMESGYGRFEYAGKKFLAHRLSYELVIGPVPAGMTLDHFCHTTDATCLGGPTCLHRRCVNPAHLEAVPGAVNTHRGNSIAAANAAKTECLHGHVLAGYNLIIRADHTGRACRTCQRAAGARYRARKLARAAA